MKHEGQAQPRLSLIVAMARNRAIGRDGKLPWHLSADLKRFKALTMGHHIVMGRKTWESVGRPLPGSRGNTGTDASRGGRGGLWSTTHSAATIWAASGASRRAFSIAATSALPGMRGDEIAVAPARRRRA